MESKAKLFGHSIHQQLVAFPVGLLATSVIFDVAAFLGGNATFGLVGHWMLVAGIISALIAAPFGIIDLMSVPDGTRASRIGILHGMGNLLVLVAFISAWAMRQGAVGQPPNRVSLLLSLVGGALILLTGWLGGELVSRLGVGVSRNAHLNAPNSLKSPESPSQT